MGWQFLNLIGKIGDRFIQNKDEAIRNRIDKIKREMNEIQNSPGPISARNVDKYERLSKLLAEEIRKATNK